MTDYWVAGVKLLNMYHMWTNHAIAFTHEASTVVKVLRDDSVHSVE